MHSGRRTQNFKYLWLGLRDDRQKKTAPIAFLASWVHLISVSFAQMIRLAIVEDHELVREGYKAILSNEPWISFVGEAGDGLEAVQLVEQTKPDVVLLDLRIPRLHGLEVLRQLGRHPKTRVLIVTMHSDEPYVVEALRNGAAGYVLKDSPPKVLIEAIRTVADGGNFLCEPLRRKTLSATLKRIIPGTNGPGLTKRELIVLE